MSTESVAQDQLRAIIERLERMHEERKAIADDIREIYAEAKGGGFNVPAIKTVLKIRGTDYDKRVEQETLVDLYLSALGMQPVGYSGAGDEYADEPRAPAPAPAREIIEEFGANSAAESTPGNAPVASSPDRREVDEDGQPITPETATKSLGDGDTAIGTGRAVVGAVNGAATSGTGVTAGETAPHPSTTPPKPLRPYCLNREKCGSSGGNKHCHSCRKTAWLDGVQAA